MVVQMILLVEVADDTSAEDNHDILDYIPRAIMRYRGCLEKDHAAHKIMDVDVPALILPRTCDHEECAAENEREREHDGKKAH